MPYMLVSGWLGLPVRWLAEFLGCCAEEPFPRVNCVDPLRLTASIHCGRLSLVKRRSALSPFKASYRNPVAATASGGAQPEADKTFKHFGRKPGIRCAAHLRPICGQSCRLFSSVQCPLSVLKPSSSRMPALRRYLLLTMNVGPTAGLCTVFVAFRSETLSFESKLSSSGLFRRPIVPDCSEIVSVLRETAPELHKHCCA